MIGTTIIVFGDTNTSFFYLLMYSLQTISYVQHVDMVLNCNVC